jgi:hypothetical protein
LQAVAGQRLPSIKTLRKKSYQKAYGRFFGFRGLCQNRCVNVEHEYMRKREREEWAQENSLLFQQKNRTEANEGNEVELPRPESESKRSAFVTFVAFCAITSVSQNAQAAQSLRKSLICRKGLTQVVDFHDICRYFQHVLMPGERDRPGRCGVRLAPRSDRKAKTRDVFGETPTTAVERSEQHKSGPLSGLTALPTNWISEYSRRFVFIRGSMGNSLNTQNRLMQLVDLQESFGYFWYGLSRMPGNSRLDHKTPFGSLAKIRKPASRPLVVRCSPHLHIEVVVGCSWSIGVSQDTR